MIKSIFLVVFLLNDGTTKEVRGSSKYQCYTILVELRREKVAESYKGFSFKCRDLFGYQWTREER